jgi:hypothetical protein
MEENVISWNLPNVISVIMMLLIIWIVFGAVGHFVFRQGAKTATVTSVLGATPPAQVLGA